MTPSIFFIAVALLLLIPEFIRRARAQRGVELRRLAGSFDLQYEQCPPVSQLKPLMDNAWLGSDSVGAMSSRHFMKGRQQGIPIAVFDYQPHLWQRALPATTVIRLELKHELPAFVIRPRYFGSTFGLWWGAFPTVRIEGHDQFSRRYIVTGRDEAGIRRLLEPAVLDFFLDGKQCYAECNGESLLIYQRGRLLKVDAIPAFIGRGMALRKLLLK